MAADGVRMMPMPKLDKSVTISVSFSGLHKASETP
jgi:hypothetical protein